MAEFVVIPALIIGAIIGLYELILIHRDENFSRSHWFTHGIHAAIFAIAATFATMNTEFVYQTFSFLQGIKFIDNPWVFKIGVGFITMIKVHAASAVVKGTIGSTKGMKETWAHSFVVSALVVLAPTIWPLIAPIFSKYL
ncbi:hypothetical protein CL617_00055 [archaeon]|nr:hypothetical protein [archaeon]|tara:strand:- start:1909 stop:2328 length:420 start_codon:yes stop_codon:yes gene_type:complete